MPQNQSSIGRFTGSLIGFGKMVKFFFNSTFRYIEKNNKVKNQAITAVERVGTAVPARWYYYLRLQSDNSLISNI